MTKITACNIRNYSIFLREPENLLFGYWEYHGEDWAKDAAEDGGRTSAPGMVAVIMPMQQPLGVAQERRMVGGGGRGLHLD